MKFEFAKKIRRKFPREEERVIFSLHHTFVFLHKNFLRKNSPAIAIFKNPQNAI